MLRQEAPKTEAELMARVIQLAGQSLGDIATYYQVAMPPNLRKHKGWVGQLLECVLGTDAGNAAEPDFKTLQIELKTVPMDRHGKPQESTYVTTVPLLGMDGRNWQTSEVRQKLQQVLWLPIEADKSKPLTDRRIGLGLLWRMPPPIDAILRQDWEELSEYVNLGKLAAITASLGEYLHIRPKAANNKALTYGLGPDGSKILTLPRGFYLRPSLAQQIFSQKC